MEKKTQNKLKQTQKNEQNEKMPKLKNKTKLR